jgi:hypothetical protein
MTDQSLYRILDANFNRAKEGLRVCEDICRYVWDEKALTRGFKDIRHELTQAIEPLGILKALEHRNIGGDVGRATTVSEAKRQDLSSVFWANAQRVKESLRVLEEITKLIDTKAADHIKKLRYQFYALEQKSLKKR